MTISEMRNALAQEHVEHLQMMSSKKLFEYALDSISDLSDAEIVDVYKHTLFEEPEVEVEVFDKENNTWHPTHILNKQAAENAISYALEMSKRKPFTWKK